MNRQIKFRIWDKQQNQWYQPIFKVYENKKYELLIDTSGEIIMRTMNDLKHESLFPDRFQIMQFTGLHDRNGKEIYEGDILKTERMTYSDSGEYIGMVEAHGEVIFTNGRYALHLSSGAMPDLHFGSSYHVVLGNRYEHPELLG
jgi:uncharacterized phage protein (TIGR01671 family)